MTNSFILKMGAEIIFVILRVIFFLPDIILKLILNFTAIFCFKEKTRQIILNQFRVINNKNSLYQWYRKIISHKRYNCSRKLFVNFFYKFFTKVRQKYRKRKQGIPVLDFIGISPLSECNLKCRGCYNNALDSKSQLSYKKIKNILTALKKNDLYVVCITGGEPLLYKDLFRMFKDFPDLYFFLFTNGLLLDKETIRKIVKYGNVVPFLALNGDRKETDFVKGSGVYDAVMKNAQFLNREGAVYGFTVLFTSRNAEGISSESFIDSIVDKGASLIWYSQYLPVDYKPDVSLMPNAAQRLQLFKRINNYKYTKSIMFIDFANDAFWVNGCTGAGKKYVHINCKGDVEPCNFIHFATHNIHSSSLEDALNSHFFCDIRSRQPYSNNAMMPCLVDCHVDILKELCKRNNTYETVNGSSKLFDDDLINSLRKYSKELERSTTL